MHRHVQAAMPPHSALLVFFKTNSNMYAFLMSKRRYMSWKLESPPVLEKDLSALLKKIGNFDADRDSRRPIDRRRLAASGPRPDRRFDGRLEFQG